MAAPSLPATSTVWSVPPEVRVNARGVGGACRPTSTFCVTPSITTVAVLPATSFTSTVWAWPFTTSLVRSPASRRTS